MKRIKKPLVALLIVLLLGIVSLPIHAQSSSAVVAQVDRTNLTTDDLLVLTVTIDTQGGSSTQPILPPIDGLEILSRSSGTQMSMVNGNVTIQSTYQYQLQPTRTGEITIDPINVFVNGAPQLTEPITIQVTQGNGTPSAPPSGSRSLFGSLLPSFPSFPSFPSLPSMPSVSPSPSQQMDPSEIPGQLAGQDFFVEGKVNNPNPYQGEQIVYT